MSFFQAGIKSKQGGTIVLAQSGAASATATLSPAVDVNKTDLRYLGCSGPNIVNESQARVKLTNGTTVTAYVAATNNGDANVEWEITERYR